MRETLGGLRCPLCSTIAAYRHNLVTHLKGQPPRGHSLSHEEAVGSANTASPASRSSVPPQSASVLVAGGNEAADQAGAAYPNSVVRASASVHQRVNLRLALGWSDGYEQICREERNVAAMFYHVLLSGDNLGSFLRLIGHDAGADISKSAVFFEYSYPRDLWYAHCQRQDMKRLIIDWLNPPNRSDLERMSTLAFNSFFGAVPTPSASDIQSPSKWSVVRFKDNIHSNEFFMDVCRFKWSFNAKPDIVIHTAFNEAICIEAKLESGEGRYPSNSAEKAEFARRALPFVSQTELQTFLMESLLGIKTRFVLLASTDTAPTGKHTSLTWRQAFGCMDMSQCPAFVRTWVERLP